MTNHNAGPFAPNGHEMAQPFVLRQQAQEKANGADDRLRQAIRRKLEASGEIEALIQQKIDERIKEDENGE